MANPQLEDGYTAVTNEIMDALMRTNFSAYERRILDCVLRKTYGWHKKTDRISYSQFEEATKIDRRHIGRALTSLKQRNFLTCTGSGYALEYGLQKDYEKWDLTPKEATIIDTSSGNELTPKEAMDTTKNLTPIQGDLTPIQGELAPKEATKSLPKEANTKAIKHLTKASTKAISKKMTFEEYVEKLVKDFPTLNIKKEWESCQVWYEEKGKTISLPKTALNNWLKLALQRQIQFSAGGANHGINQKVSPRQLPATYTDPQEYIKQQRDKANGLSQSQNS